MNPDALMGSLERFARTISPMVEGVPDADLRWRPDSDSWSILEILCHLADEEMSDFRMRLRLTLEDPSQEWPPIDPEGWAVERRYNEESPQEVLARFVDARDQSLRWLRGLESPDWAVTYTHPKLGSMSAGDLLLCWASHDLLHLRQITKRLYQIAQCDGEPFRSGYAGSWTA